MTEPIRCDVCDGTGKTVERVYDPDSHQWVEYGERDCVCVIEQIEAERADARLKDN